MSYDDVDPEDIQFVRDAINIPETTELSDNVIANAIERADLHISGVVAEYISDESLIDDKTQKFIDAAVRNRAVFLAYQTYTDRVLNVPTGHYTQDGYQADGEQIDRSHRVQKNTYLKTTSDESSELLVRWLSRFSRPFSGSSSQPSIFYRDLFSHPGCEVHQEDQPNPLTPEGRGDTGS